MVTFTLKDCVCNFAGQNPNTKMWGFTTYTQAKEVTLYVKTFGRLGVSFSCSFNSLRLRLRLFLLELLGTVPGTDFLRLTALPF